MTFEELQDLLAEQFSCDTEAIGEEIDESELSDEATIGELWRFIRDKAENAEL